MLMVGKAPQSGRSHLLALIRTPVLVIVAAEIVNDSTKRTSIVKTKLQGRATFYKLRVLIAGWQ